MASLAALGADDLVQADGVVGPVGDRLPGGNACHRLARWQTASIDCDAELGAEPATRVAPRPAIARPLFALCPGCLFLGAHDGRSDHQPLEIGVSGDGLEQPVGQPCDRSSDGSAAWRSDTIRTIAAGHASARPAVQSKTGNRAIKASRCAGRAGPCNRQTQMLRAEPTERG